MQLKTTRTTTQRNIRLQNYSLTTPVYINKCYLQEIRKVTFYVMRNTVYTLSAHSLKQQQRTFMQHILIVFLRYENERDEEEDE